jgi:hypothetical protein
LEEKQKEKGTKMSLIGIVEDYKKNAHMTLDRKAFKAALDTHDGEIDILYEIYLAQESCNKLTDIMFDVSRRLEDMEDMVCFEDDKEDDDD